MHKIALVLAIAAVGEGLLALHLVRQLHEEREGAQALQARVTELERRAPQPTKAATFVAVPTQPAGSPFSVINGNAPVQLQPVQGQALAIATPNGQDLREQMSAAMQRQRALLQDPEYREAIQTQQKMMLRQANPEVGRDLDLTAEQVDRLFGALAEQSLRSMEVVSTLDQRPNATPEELQRKALEQQSSNEAELKNVLGDAKYREWQDYQNTAPARYEAARLRGMLAEAGVPLDPSLAKPLQKILQEHQKAEQLKIKEALGQDPGAQIGFVIDNAQSAVALLPHGEERMQGIQRRQREQLARVLTPEQLEIIKEEQNAQLQFQRVQTKLMRAQQSAVAGDTEPAANSDGVLEETVITRHD